MLDFHEKRRLKRFLLSRAALLVLLAAAILLGSATWDIAKTERETRRKVAEKSAELAGLEARAEELEREIERLSTPRGLEEEFRRKFEVAKEGEGIIVLVEPARGEGENVPSAPERSSLLSRILGLLGLGGR